MAERLPFGTMIRRQRESAQIGLRELARRVGMSPTYLSKVETDQFKPPAEDKLVAMAKELKLDPDAVIAHAGRVPADVLETIKQHPVEMATLIRTVGKLAADKDMKYASR
jgi:transcriptional regulator with XRE-family HTH domain